MTTFEHYVGWLEDSDNPAHILIHVDELLVNEIEDFFPDGTTEIERVGSYEIMRMESGEAGREHFNLPAALTGMEDFLYDLGDKNEREQQ